MKISPDLINILRCPESQQELTMADAELLSKLNRGIDQKQLKNHAGELVEEPLEAGLIRSDRQRLYPIKDGFPIMLIDETIDLE